MSATSKKGPKKKAPPKKTQAPEAPAKLSRQVRVYLAGFFVLLFLCLSLLLLAKLKDTFAPRPAPPAVQQGDPRQLREDVLVELESALLRGGYGAPAISGSRQEGRLILEVRGEYPEPSVIEQLGRRLGRIPGALEFSADPGKKLLIVRLGGEETHLVRFVAPEPATIEELLTHPALVPPETGARVAIVLDDLGRDMEPARRLAALSIPITFAVMPNTERSREVAALAHRAGREVIIHIPMEPKGFPRNDPGENALFVHQSAGKIRRLFLGYLDRVPHAVGGNNHMGSRFTEDEPGMGTVLSLMAEQGLYFIDSRTTSNSVARKSAGRAGVPFATRDIFLDNDRDLKLIREQIRKLVEKALKNGQALGIGHPYPETLEALELEQDRFLEAGVRVVYASELLERP